MKTGLIGFIIAVVVFIIPDFLSLTGLDYYITEEPMFALTYLVLIFGAFILATILSLIGIFKDEQRGFGIAGIVICLLMFLRFMLLAVLFIYLLMLIS